MADELVAPPPPPDVTAAGHHSNHVKLFKVKLAFALVILQKKPAHLSVQAQATTQSNDHGPSINDMIDDTPPSSHEEFLQPIPINWQVRYEEAESRILKLAEQVKELENTKTELTLAMEMQRASHKAYVEDLDLKCLQLQSIAEQRLSIYADLEALKTTSEQSWMLRWKEAESSKVQEAQKLTMDFHQLEETRANDIKSYEIGIEELRKLKDEEILSLRTQLDEAKILNDANVVRDVNFARSKNLEVLKTSMAKEIYQIKTRINELETSKSFQPYATPSSMNSDGIIVPSTKQCTHLKTEEAPEDTSERDVYHESSNYLRIKIKGPKLPSSSSTVSGEPIHEIELLDSYNKDNKLLPNDLNSDNRKPKRKTNPKRKAVETGPSKMITRSQARSLRERRSDTSSFPIIEPTRSKPKAALHSAVKRNLRPRKPSAKARDKENCQSPTPTSDGQKTKLQIIENQLNSNVPCVRTSELVDLKSSDQNLGERDSPLAPYADLQDWQWESQMSICDSICPELRFNEKFLEIDTSDLTDQVNFLHTAKTPSEIASAFESVCESMTEIIDILYTTRRNNSVDDKLQFSIKRRKTRNSSSSSKPETELKICDSVEHTIYRLSNSLLSIQKIENSELLFKISGSKHTIIKSCVKLFNCIIDGIYLSSAEILSSSDPNTCYDLRNGLSHTVTAFFMRLKYTSQVEQDILEATLYIVLEAIGKCFAVERDDTPTHISDQSPSAVHNSSSLSKVSMKFKILVLKETAGYIRLILKGILPRFKQFVEKCSARGELNDTTKKRCHEAIMFGVFGPEMEILDNFGDNNEPKSYLSPVVGAIGRGKSWGGVSVDSEFERVDPKFANEIWEMLGLESQ